MKKEGGINLPGALKAYFLGQESYIVLEETFKRLSKIEKQFLMEKYGLESAEPVEARITTCQALLGSMDIGTLFPEEKAIGTFEGVYDAVHWRELFYFGQPDKSSGMLRVDLENSQYRAYRKTLYSRTIAMICETIGSYVFSQLSAEEKLEIERQSDQNRTKEEK